MGRACLPKTSGLEGETPMQATLRAAERRERGVEGKVSNAWSSNLKWFFFWSLLTLRIAQQNPFGNSFFFNQGGDEDDEGDEEEEEEQGKGGPIIDLREGVDYHIVEEEIIKDEKVQK